MTLVVTPIQIVLNIFIFYIFFGGLAEIKGRFEILLLSTTMKNKTANTNKS